MKDEDGNNNNWFSRWEDDLPPPEELMPLSQSLITPDLAQAFQIHKLPDPPGPLPELSELPEHPVQLPEPSSPPELLSSDEPARTLKRPRLVWTPQLHKRFVDAVAHLGIKNAVPKTIMQLMNVDGLTRENVASHLQKYRLYLKRMQGLSPEAQGQGTHDHLFSQAGHHHHHGLVHHRGAEDVFSGQVGLTTIHNAHHQFHHHHQSPYQSQGHHHQQHHIASGGVGFFDHRFLGRPQHHQGMVGGRLGVGPGGVLGPATAAAGIGGGVVQVEDVEGSSPPRKVLTLFPTADD
ncbi:hypothetical protein AMTRI_Chr01g103470 [Amborella trichopoda]